jgi:hypothetical protein
MNDVYLVYPKRDHYEKVYNTPSKLFKSKEDAKEFVKKEKAKYLENERIETKYNKEKRTIYNLFIKSKYDSKNEIVKDARYFSIVTNNEFRWYIEEILLERNNLTKKELKQLYFPCILNKWKTPKQVPLFFHWDILKRVVI